MDWDRKKCIALINAYKKNTALWNPQNGSYYNKTKRYDAWVNVSEVIDCSPEEAKKKMDSMLSSFRREKLKGKKSVGNKSVYKSNWFAFKRMEFLLDKDEPKTTLNTSQVEYSSGNNLEELESNLDIKLQYESADEFDTEIPSTPPSVQKNKILKTKHTKSTEEQKIGEAINILQKVASMNSSQSQFDDCSVYGQHVAHKLRAYCARTKAIVQHQINNILFNADMGQFDEDQLSVSSTLYPSDVLTPAITMQTDNEFSRDD